MLKGQVHLAENLKDEKKLPKLKGQKIRKADFLQKIYKARSKRC